MSTPRAQHTTKSTANLYKMKAQKCTTLKFVGYRFECQGSEATSLLQIPKIKLRLGIMSRDTSIVESALTSIVSGNTSIVESALTSIVESASTSIMSCDTSIVQSALTSIVESASTSIVSRDTSIVESASTSIVESGTQYKYCGD